MAQEMIVSFSALKDWRHCRQLHYYRRYMGITRKLRPVPFKMGSLIHSTIEAYLMDYDTPFNPKAKGPQTELSVEGIIAQARLEWSKMMIEEIEHYGDLPGTAEGIISRYMKMYPDDPDQTLAVEVSFGPKESDDYPPVELLPGLFMKGRIDWVMEDPQRGLGILDHKSFGKQMPNEEHRLLDLQTVLYQAGWNNTPELVKEFGKTEFVGFNYVGSKPPTIPTLTLKGKLSQAVIATTADVILAAAAMYELPEDDESVQALIAKCAKPESDWFARKILYKPDYLVKNLLDEVGVIAREMAHLSEYPYRNTGRHCSSCEFCPLCSAELLGLDTDYILAHDYVTKEVNDKDGTEETPEEEDILE